MHGKAHFNQADYFHIDMRSALAKFDLRATEVEQKHRT